jgi:integrase
VRLGFRAVAAPPRAHASHCHVLRPDGSRVRRSGYGKTRKDVAGQLAVLIAKTKAGLPFAVESWTVKRFAEHGLKHVGRRLRSSTLSSYRKTLW